MIVPYEDSGFLLQSFEKKINFIVPKWKVIYLNIVSI